MQLEKPKLFPEKKTFVWVMLVLVLVILVRLFIEYQSYQSFISKPFYYTHAKVLHAYEKSKGNKRYQVLKLRSEDGFTFLSTIMLILVALFPSLLVSLGFGLSVVGVFYIFLLLRYSKGVKTWVISLIFIPSGIFVLVLPIVHSVFGVTSGYQLLSPLLSLLFVPFYPLVMVLHLLDFGGVFDTFLLALFNLPQSSTESFLPIWVMLGYVGLSIGAIWSKKLFWSVVSLALFYALYIFSL